MIDSQAWQSKWPHREWDLPSSINYQQSRILVNARKSELANWNHTCVKCDNVREDNDITLLLVLSKSGARRLGKARDANVSRPNQA